MNGNKSVTMDFFAQQEKARRHTGYLIFLFILAVIAIVLCAYLAVSFALFLLSSKVQAEFAHYNPFQLKTFLYIAGGVILLVSLGSLFKIIALGKGGTKVAETLGGVLVDSDTKNPQERKLLNVIEEMSIAAGIPIPLVYVLQNEDSVNAFAAGFSPSSAVIGVTKGAIESLSRDELQGVVAHEFSHILNGDMRLNIRLIGALHGILLIGITGRVLLELILRGRMHGRRSSRKKDGGGMVLVILGLGLALFLIGYIGVFFGKLIKSAVSRKREFLADSSAVQFTRNPDGLCGALKKIGAEGMGSKVRNAHAEEASHLFFGNALSPGFFRALLDTHPPLDRRIRLIDPSWDGKYPPFKPQKPPYHAFSEQSKKPISAQYGFPIPGKIIPGIPSQGGKIAIDPERLMGQVGILNPALIAQAGNFLSQLPEELKESVRDAHGAKSVVFSFLINPDAATKDKQWKYLDQTLDPETIARVKALHGKIQTLGPEERLCLLDLAMPAFRLFKPDEARQFLKDVDALVHADEKVSLFEYALGKILRKTLDPIISGKPDKAPIQYYAFNALKSQISLLTSAMAIFGNETEEDRLNAFHAAMEKMGFSMEERGMEKENDISWERLDEALNRLRQAAPIIKKRLMEGLAWCVAADGTVTMEEGALFRAIAEVLDCPLPPLGLSQSSPGLSA